MTQIIEDNNYWIIGSNKWSKSICTKEQSIKYSDTLINCENCINCNYCRFCINCINCSSCCDCSGCRDCRFCSDCINCSGCRDCRFCRFCINCSSCCDCSGCRDCRFCRDCINCSGCCDCSGCRDCINCIDCRDCINCRFCRDCSNFKTNPQRIISPNLGSRNSQTTFYWNEEKEQIVCGCFKGTLQEFENKIKETHGENYFAKGYFQWIAALKNYKLTYGGNK